MVLDCLQGDVFSVVQVIDVELGSMVPGISNLGALPCPTGVLWPQSVFDLDYGGMVQLLHSLAIHSPSHHVRAAAPSSRHLVILLNIRLLGERFRSMLVKPRHHGMQALLALPACIPLKVCSPQTIADWDAAQAA